MSGNSRYAVEYGTCTMLINTLAKECAYVLISRPYWTTWLGARSSSLWVWPAGVSWQIIFRTIHGTVPKSGQSRIDASKNFLKRAQSPVFCLFKLLRIAKTVVSGRSFNLPVYQAKGKAVQYKGRRGLFVVSGINRPRASVWRISDLKLVAGMLSARRKALPSPPLSLDFQYINCVKIPKLTNSLLSPTSQPQREKNVTDSQQ